MNDSPSDRLVAQWLALRREINELEQPLERRLQEEVGISFIMYALLCTATDENCAPNQQAIADTLGLNKSSISRHIDTAMRRGLVTTQASETSRREKEITLTTSGIEAVRQGDRLLEAMANASETTKTRRAI